MKQLATEHITTIIWDWNGTLLDDVQACLDCINILLGERNKPLLAVKKYREIFTFPVKEYYIKAGFDFSNEPFEIPAHQFIELYREHIRTSPLQKNAVKILTFLKEQGFGQTVLSAMEQELLNETLADKSIDHFFSHIYGINNHLGAGKTEIAGHLLHDIGLPNDKICLIGDTVHDFEVASALGVTCILVASGHQSKSRLEKLDCIVTDSLDDLFRIFNNR